MARLSYTLRSLSVVALLCAGLFAAALFSSPPGRAAPIVPSGEYIQTYAADCVTPQTIFYLGDTVCAQAGDFPLPLTSRYRRFLWKSPDSSVADLTTIKLDPQVDKFVIPTTGAFAQLGTWYVRSIDASAEGHTSAKFVVRSREYRLADLWITNIAPERVLPGARIMYKLEIGNPGPDLAEGASFTTEVPSDMIFVALKQVSGPYVECSTPLRGGTGRIICNMKALSLDEKAVFDLYYQVNPDAREGTVCSTSSSIQSYTEELNKYDNFWDTEVTVRGPDPEGSGDGEVEP